MGEPDLAGEARQLRDDISELAGKVAALTAKVGRHDERQARTARWLKRANVGLAVSLVLDLVLTGVIAWNTARINGVQHRTSTQVLCPLYDLLLGQYHPERQPPEKLAEYDAMFDSLRKSQAALDCGG